MTIATFITAVTLIAIGLIGYFCSATTSLTALIPAAVGVVLGICALISLKTTWHKAAIAIAMIIGLFGFLAASMRLPKSYQAWQSCGIETGCPLALISQACMAFITLLYVVTGIRAYIRLHSK